MPYEKIILALSLSVTDQPLIKKAQGLIKEERIELYLIHAVEHINTYGAAYGISAGIDVENVLLEEAKKSVKEIASSLNVPLIRQIVKIGSPKFIILDQAEKIEADLILVGSHGRHGIQLLLGSTANAVLHGAKCDVLAVRLKE